MAFTVTITPHNLGSLKAAVVVPTYTGTGSNSLSVTPATFGMSKIIGAYSEAGDSAATGGTGASGVILRYNRVAGSIELWSADNAVAVASNNTALSGPPTLLIIGV